MANEPQWAEWRPDLRMLTFTGTKVVRLTHRDWPQVCSIAGLVSRDNPAGGTMVYHDACGESPLTPEDRHDYYLMLRIPEELSACKVRGHWTVQVAFHGDYLVQFESGRILVIQAIADESKDGMLLETGPIAETVKQNFVFNKADFPRHSRWLHEKSGETYIITGYSNTKLPGKPDYPPRIRYENLSRPADDDFEYSRVASDWHRSMRRIDA